jgi:YD repeat-containing protein
VYDEFGRLANYVGDDGRSVEFRYDEAGREIRGLEPGEYLPVVGRSTMGGVDGRADTVGGIGNIGGSPSTQNKQPQFDEHGNFIMDYEEEDVHSVVVIGDDGDGLEDGRPDSNGEAIEDGRLVTLPDGSVVDLDEFDSLDDVWNAITGEGSWPEFLEPTPGFEAAARNMMLGIPVRYYHTSQGHIVDWNDGKIGSRSITIKFPNFGSVTIYENQHFIITGSTAFYKFGVTPVTRPQGPQVPNPKPQGPNVNLNGPGGGSNNGQSGAGYDNPAVYQVKPPTQTTPPIADNKQEWYHYKLNTRNGKQMDIYFSSMPGTNGAVPNGTSMIVRDAGARSGTIRQMSGGRWSDARSITFATENDLARGLFGDIFDFSKAKITAIQSFADNNN